MQPLLNIAIRAARSGGDTIVRKLNRLEELTIEEKAPNDFVSEVDRLAENKIIETLLKAYPDHGIIAEESGSAYEDRETVWIIDPLDGTNNFLHGFPHFAVSIACQHQGKLEHGVIYDPVQQEIFSATRGSGATVNNKRMRVSKARNLDGTLLSTGFPFRQKDRMDEVMNVFMRFFAQVSDVRRTGSAALDMAYVAAGRLDGYWESGLQPWDLAAGMVILREAGGLCTDFSGEDRIFATGEVIAANPKLFTEMLRLIQNR